MTHTPLDVTRRPGLAYQHAFDWLAVKLCAAGGPTAYRVNSDWQLLEMARRLPEVPALGADPVWRQKVAASLGRYESAGMADGPRVAIGLMEPQLSERHLFGSLRQSLSPGGHLHVVAGGRLARFLAERQRDDAPMPAEAAVVAAARAAGFRVVERLGVHPPAAVVRHYMGEAALGGGRRAARDRQHFAMRRAMVTSGAGAALSALVCLTLERGS